MCYLIRVVPALLLVAVASCVEQAPLSPISRVANEECPPMELRAAATPLQPYKGAPASNNCGGDPGQGTTSPAGVTPGLVLPFTLATCLDVSLGDSDVDGVNDECERVVATRFAPLLNVQRSEFRGDVERIPGEYYYGVMRLPGDYHLRILYLPAYYRDLGFVPGAGHAGDSEFIVIDVSFNAVTGRYYTQAVFLSAHCGADLADIIELDPDCQWYNWDRFPFWVDDVPRGAPRIWVANNKHANYYSEAKCFQGSYGDNCLHERAEYRFPITDGFNFGSQWNRLGDVTARRNNPTPDLSTTRTENLFAVTGRFFGWQLDDYGEGSTAHGLILNRFGFLWIGTSGDGNGLPGNCSPGSRFCRQ